MQEYTYFFATLAEKSVMSNDINNLKRRINRLEWNSVVITIILITVLVLSLSLFKMRQEMQLIKKGLQPVEAF